MTCRDPLQSPVCAARRICPAVRSGALLRVLQTRAIYAWRRRARLQGLFGGCAPSRRTAGASPTPFTIWIRMKTPDRSNAGARRRCSLWPTWCMCMTPAQPRLVAARFGRRQGVVIVPHGHYLGYYPNTVSRGEARAALSLPADAFVFVCLGLLRPYKGLEELLPAFRSLPERDLVLLLAGKPGSKNYLSALQALVRGR